MVSIIIPIYNAKKWLKECLDSIEKQSYSDFEVLMVDDGSTDGSAVICKSFADKDVRFRYLFQNNAGVSVARNTGLSHSKGDWISFIDADDTIDLRFLEEMLNHAGQYDAVKCDYTTAINLLGKQGKTTLLSKEKYLKDTIYEKCKTPTLWSFLYRHSIISDNNLYFTPGCIRNEDYEFFMKYLSFCERPVVVLEYVGYYYRQNPNSVMHQFRSRTSVLMSIEATKNVEKKLEDIGVIPKDSRLTAFSVTTFLFLMSKEKNRELYDELHELFPIHSYIKTSMKYGSTRVKGAAFLYRIMGQRFFYVFFSSFILAKR